MLRLAATLFAVGLFSALIGFTGILGLAADVLGYTGISGAALAILKVSALFAVLFLIFRIFRKTAAKKMTFSRGGRCATGG